MGSSGVRAASVLTAVAVSALLVAGCGEETGGPPTEEPQELDLALDFYVNPDHAGIYTALERGFFEDAGLDLRPRVPSDPSAPVRQVAAGQVDLAISYQPEVLLAREVGLDVVAVGALVPEPLTSLIWIEDSGLDGVSELAGRTVATAGIPYQVAFLEAIAGRAGISADEIERVDVGLNLLPAVLSGRADAMLGGFRNVEGVDLRLRGEHPTVLPVDELGVPTYDELVIVASGESLDEQSETIRAFLSALERGTRAAAADPAAATDAVLSAGEGLDPRLTRAEVQATLPLLRPPKGRPFGHMSETRWQRFGDFLFDQGQLSERPDVSGALTNDYLPSSP
jgi:putative hydroxymethylpyrimidine transport system substrate-binding protein